MGVEFEQPDSKMHKLNRTSLLIKVSFYEILTQKTDKVYIGRLFNENQKKTLFHLKQSLTYIINVEIGYPINVATITQRIITMKPYFIIFIVSVHPLLAAIATHGIAGGVANA